MNSWNRAKSLIPVGLRWRILKSPLGGVITNLQHIGLRPDDVFIGAYPKSGSTWLRFMLFQLLFERPGGFAEVDSSIPFVGRHGQARRSAYGRFIMTHEPYRAEYRKAVYLVRDPRDVVLSEFQYWRWIGALPPQSSFDSFLDMFLAGESNRHGSWQANVTAWLRAVQQRQPILLLKFESLRADPAQALAGLCKFLGAGEYPEAIATAVTSNSLTAMRQRELEADGHFGNVDAHGSFVRSGMAGGWREQLRPVDVARIEADMGDLLRELGYDSADVKPA